MGNQQSYNRLVFKPFKKEVWCHCNSIGMPSDCKILLLLDNCAVDTGATILQYDDVVAYFFYET